MSRNIDALTNSDLEQIRSNSAYVLPNNPTQQGWSAERIKDKLWKPAQLLFYIIQKVQADEIADFDEFTAFVKALTEEGSKIALRAKEDSNGNVIIETYETKADAKSTLETLESEISAEQTARISGDNSTLSTAKSYSNANLETAKSYANTKKAEAIDYTKDVYANHKIEYNDLNSRVTESEADITSLFDRTSSVSLAYDNKTGVLSITVNGQTKTMDLDLERAGIAYSIDESTGELVITDSTGAVKRYALSKILNLMTGTDTDTIDVTVENGNVSAVVKDGSISLDKLDSTTKSAMQSAISAQSEEATRIANELARETAETTRASNESTRQSNEETRKSNEVTRQSNETARQTGYNSALSAFNTNGKSAINAFNSNGSEAIQNIQTDWSKTKEEISNYAILKQRNETLEGYITINSIQTQMYENLIANINLTISEDDTNVFAYNYYVNNGLLYYLIENSKISFADTVTSSIGMFVASPLKSFPPNFPLNNITDVSGMFALCYDLLSVHQPASNTTITAYDGLCFYCLNLLEIDWDMSGAVVLDYAFEMCTKLKATPSGDLTNCISMDDTFKGCTSLETFNFTNIGCSFDLSDCVRLTHDTLVSIISTLLTVTNGSTLTLGTTLKALLSDSEIQVATDKGWTIN